MSNYETIESVQARAIFNLEKFENWNKQNLDVTWMEYQSNLEIPMLNGLNLEILMSDRSNLEIWMSDRSNLEIWMSDGLNLEILMSNLMPTMVDGFLDAI